MSFVRGSALAILLTTGIAALPKQSWTPPQQLPYAAVHDPCDRMLGFLPALSTQEALAFGEAVPMPMRLRFRDLPADALPLGQAELHEDGCAALADRNFVGRVVARWRGAAETKAPATDPSPASAQPVSLWPMAAQA